MKSSCRTYSRFGCLDDEVPEAKLPLDASNWPFLPGYGAAPPGEVTGDGLIRLTSDFD